MAITRRTLLTFLASGAISAAIPLERFARAVLPRRTLEALRAKRYPGPVVPLNPADIAKPGPWAG